MKNISNKKGSTLIEVLISMAVVTIAALGGIALYHNASEIEGIALHKKYALEAANSKLEEIRNTSFGSVVSVPQADVNLGGLIALESDGLGITVTVTQPSTYKQVQVDVNWREPGMNEKMQNITLVTLKAP